jgi:hypothetical protein
VEFRDWLGGEEAPRLDGLHIPGTLVVVLLSSAVSWGSVPDWVAAIGSVLAFVGFGVALLREVRLRRIDDERTAEDRRQLEAERRDTEANQARQVTTAVGYGFNTKARWTASITLANESVASVTDVAVELVPARPPDDMPEMTGEAQRRLPICKTVQRVVGNGGTAMVDISVPHCFEEPKGTDPDPSWEVARAYFVRVEFTDCHGRRWQRRGTQQPTRVLPREPDVIGVDNATGRATLLWIKTHAMRPTDRWLGEQEQ